MGIVSARGVEVFCAVVEAGSFTVAAGQLGVTPAAVSRAVAKHEAALGMQLFRRTTRSMRLTDEGQAYYEACRQALSLVEGAERTLSQRQASPRGLVRISVPTTYGHHRVLPAVAAFRERHPTVSFEVNVANRNVDFVAEGYDLAVRMGELDDSTMVVRKLEDAPLGVFAAPAYLERRPAPRSVADLDGHALVSFVRPSTGRVLAWGFRDRDGSPFEIVPDKSLRCSDDFLGCVTLARHGAGLVQAYRYLVADDLARGTLVEVLKPFAGRTRPFSLLMPARRTPTLAVRLFADALVEACREPPAPPPLRARARRSPA